MKTMTAANTLSIAAAALVLSSGVAAAAVTEADVKMRSGPGTNNPVMGVIPAGASVDVLGCRTGWCRVRYAGRIGYASERYLESVRRAPSVRIYEYGPAYAYGYYSPFYSYSYGPTIGLEVSRGGIRIHRRSHHWRGNDWSRGQHGSRWSGRQAGSAGHWPQTQVMKRAPIVSQGGRASGAISGRSFGLAAPAPMAKGQSPGISASPRLGGRGAMTAPNVASSLGSGRKGP
jgi:uncharacterized protein YraI